LTTNASARLGAKVTPVKLGSFAAQNLIIISIADFYRSLTLPDRSDEGPAMAEGFPEPLRIHSYR
jgi:hypothetical protein